MAKRYPQQMVDEISKELRMRHETLPVQREKGRIYYLGKDGFVYSSPQKSEIYKAIEKKLEQMSQAA